MKSKQYQAILADLDGTVNRGSALIPGADAAYSTLTARGLRWVFVSNAATRLATDLARKINGLGIPVPERQVVNSASALIRRLERNYPAAKVMVVGEPRLSEGLRQAGITLSDDPSETDIVTAALDTGFNFDKLSRAHRAIVNGALFWATNLDATFPTPDGFLPGAGSIVAAIATAVGRPPDYVFGKPSPDMAELALEILNLSAESCLVIGDRMETDILFAKNAGMDSALVLTGASSAEDVGNYSFSPDYILESLFEVVSLFDSLHSD